MVVKRSLFVVRILRELNRILNGMKQRHTAPASHIPAYVGGSRRRRKMMMVLGFFLVRTEEGHDQVG